MFTSHDIPAFPISHPSTEEGKEALRLYGVALEAAERVQDARQLAHTSAAAVVAGARRERDDEVARSVSAPVDPNKLRQLETTLDEAELDARPANHQRRHALALDAQRRAVEEFRMYARTNARVLFEEIRADAEEATERLAEARESIAPFANAYTEALTRSDALVAIVVPGTADRGAWAPGHRALPVPMPRPR